MSEGIAMLLSEGLVGTVPFKLQAGRGDVVHGVLKGVNVKGILCVCVRLKADSGAHGVEHSHLIIIFIYGYFYGLSKA